MPFQRTVRAANTRTSAAGCAEAGGSRPALERSAVCQFTERSPSQYFAADTLIGTASSNNKTSTNLLTKRKDLGWRDTGHIGGNLDITSRRDPFAARRPVPYPGYEQSFRKGYRR